MGFRDSTNPGNKGRVCDASNFRGNRTKREGGERVGPPRGRLSGVERGKDSLGGKFFIRFIPRKANKV